jgi:hypothetical protein
MVMKSASTRCCCRSDAGGASIFFGFARGISPLPPLGAVQTTLIGGLAAAAAFGIAKLIGH